MDEKKRIFSGMRPTGKLHYGHMAGALINWVKLQNDYNCFWGIVDWHAMMSDYADCTKVKANCREILLDWLAVGVDPEKSSIFIQSHVKQHAEIHLALSMITPLGWLERCPTYKEQILNLQNKDLSTYAFLGYPVLMAGDILLYKSWAVPVGEDQGPHLELTREVARRFNHFYGDIFPEPETLLTPTAKMPGTDGRKMSKSYDNFLGVFDDEKILKKKIGQIVTVRQRRYVVSDIQQSTIPLEVLSKNGDKPQHLISLSSIEDDALGETLQVIWEIEPDARINEKSGLPDPAGFDSPIKFLIFLSAPLKDPARSFREFCPAFQWLLFHELSRSYLS